MKSRLLNLVLSLAVVVWLVLESTRDASAFPLGPAGYFLEHEVGCGHMANKFEPLLGFDFFYGTWSSDPEHQSDLLSMHYYNFGFVAADWRDDMARKYSGWDAQTDVCLPFARTMNALHVLAYGVSTTPPSSRDDKDENFAMWAYRHSHEKTKKLRANCDGSPIAKANAGEKRITVCRPFYYGVDHIPPVRASTVVHEARHIRGKCKHEGSCLAGASCDPNYMNGCAGKNSGSGKGANGVEIVWLSWFLYTARPSMINEAIRVQTLQRANWILDNRFGTHPGVWMGDNGGFYEAKK
ncbi:MAG: hypothetical protein FWD57_15030 [Polyangiaceae bacterium]|nr:hypothetical protein [Polyangiaceae bacterium]